MTDRSKLREAFDREWVDRIGPEATHTMWRFHRRISVTLRWGLGVLAASIVAQLVLDEDVGNAVPVALFAVMMLVWVVGFGTAFGLLMRGQRETSAFLQVPRWHSPPVRTVVSFDAWMRRHPRAARTLSGRDPDGQSTEA